MELLSTTPPHALQLLTAPFEVQQQMITRLVTELALSGPVRVLDGGNRFDVLRINRALRGKKSPYYAALERIRVARAFTCYQMLTLLEETRFAGSPTLVLNLLATFRDENVPLPERQRLLRSALHWLTTAARRDPVMIILHPPPADDPFLEPLQAAVERWWVFEAAEPVRQPPLFGFDA
jgi:hypothetical protein